MLKLASDSHQKMLFRMAVLLYVDSIDKKLPVKVFIFCKAASAALQKKHTFTVYILIISGMIKENS